MTNSAPFRLGYRRSLDGVRGCAIFLVLIVHGEVLGSRFEGYGFLAVNTFFVLSGFLITCLLIEEYDQTGKLKIGHFYMRRALRLLPALVSMLVIFVIIVLLADPMQRAIRHVFEALRTLFYYSNWAKIFHIGRNVHLLHTWSLAIEEQFYIIWPLILAFLVRKTSRNSMMCWIFLMAFLSVILRIALYVGGTEAVGDNVFPGINPERLSLGSDTRADSLLLGCLTGVLVSGNRLPSDPRFVQRHEIFAGISALGLCLLGFANIYCPSMIYLGWFFESVFAAVLISHLAVTNTGHLHLIFGNPIAVYLGKISYGLYVWHYPILTLMKQHQLPWSNLGYLVVVFPVTLLSYFFIEKPFLRAKRQFSTTDQAII